jgi:hypothetical protein
VLQVCVHRVGITQYIERYFESADLSNISCDPLDVKVQLVRSESFSRSTRLMLQLEGTVDDHEELCNNRLSKDEWSKFIEHDLLEHARS